MTNIALNSFKLSMKLWISFSLVQSWWEHLNFEDEIEAIEFFNNNRLIIEAHPFVKWVWWKRQLIPQLEKYLPSEFWDYFEPFLWWWALFFNLQKKQSFLSDINEELINAYKIVKSKPKKLIKFLETCEYNRAFFEKIRAWDREENWQEKYSNVERAWRFIYLNRTCFNWMYRVNSKWQFNVPFWTYSNPDFIQEKNILNTSKLLRKTKAEIKVLSFEKVVKKVKKWDLVYFDPPYDTLSDTSNFTSYNKNWFWKNMQVKLRNIFVKLDEKWAKVMLSNHNTEFIREIYKDYNIHVVNAKRNINSVASKRGNVEEVIITNY